MKNWKQENPSIGQVESNLQWAIYTAAELSEATPELDLHHEFYKDDLAVINSVRSFLEHEQISDKRKEDKIVRIIHGRGQGKLKKTVQDYLTKIQKEHNSFVLDWRNSNKPDEIGGVTYVRLAPNS